MNAGKKSLVHTHEIQVVVIRHVGLRANPVHLLPKQNGDTLHLSLVQGKTIVHEYAEVSTSSWHFKDILLKMACAEIRRVVEDVPLIPTFTR
jgi:hypothetical protein